MTLNVFNNENKGAMSDMMPFNWNLEPIMTCLLKGDYNSQKGSTTMGQLTTHQNFPCYSGAAGSTSSITIVRLSFVQRFLSMFCCQWKSSKNTNFSTGGSIISHQ